MPTIAPSAVGVMLLVVALAAVMVALVRRAWHVTGASAAEQTRVTSITTVALMIWLAVTAWFTSWPFMADFFSLPPPMFRLLAPALVAVFTLVFSSTGERLLRGLSYQSLVGLQGFRFFLELLFFQFHAEGLVPVQMTMHGRNFDLLTGASALLLAVVLRGRPNTPALRTIVCLWNVMGSALLLNIVAVAALSMPGRLRAFHNEPANTFVFHFPYIWIVLFFVMAAFFGHALIFRKLWADARGARALNPKTQPG